MAYVNTEVVTIRQGYFSSTKKSLVVLFQKPELGYTKARAFLVFVSKARAWVNHNSGYLFLVYGRPGSV